MKKSFAKLGLALLLLLSTANIVWADSQSPVLKLTSFSLGENVVYFSPENPEPVITDPYTQPNTTLEQRYFSNETFYVDQLPAEFSVNGTFDSPALKDLTLFVNDAVVHESENLNRNETGGVFSLPWTITEPGNYNIKVTAKHGNEYGEAHAGIILEVNVTVDYKAAPAIAAEILKENDVKPNKGKMNFISEVARHMGPGTDFCGYEKEDVENYRAAVYNFLVKLGAIK